MEVSVPVSVLDTLVLDTVVLDTVVLDTVVLDCVVLVQEDVEVVEAVPDVVEETDTEVLETVAVADVVWVWLEVSVFVVLLEDLLVERLVVLTV